MTTERESSDSLNIPVGHFPDRSARWLFEQKENIRGLLEIIAPELVELLNFSQLTQLNRSFISDALRAQESDMVFSVPFRHSTETRDELVIYILLEHQSTVDPTMGFRLLFYMCQLWDAQRREWESDNVPKSEWQLRPILPIVFYTGSQRWQTPLSLEPIMDVPEVLSRFIPRFDTLFLGVKDAPPGDLTQTDHPLGWLLRVLQEEAGDVVSLREVLREALSHLGAMDTESSSQRERWILYLLLLILHRRPSEEREDLLGVVKEHTADMEVESMAESIIELSERRGLERGIVQGIEQGETRAKQAAVLKLLQLRFENVPETIATQVNAIHSVSRLDTLFERALAASTLEDFNV